MKNFTEDQKLEFELVSKPLIQWMAKNTNPHCTTIVDNTHAELFEGVCCASVK